MKTAMWIIAGSISALVFTCALMAATFEKREFSRGYMRQKLAYSQGVLEGLALENFELVTKNGIRIRNMKLTNMLYSVKNPLYVKHLTNYQHSVDRLLDASTDKNLDRATRAYLGVLQSCVECHRDYRTDQHKAQVIR
jgi:hypothetical protein